ncbi:uncharacterized protein LOC144304917 isoform X3 [Canis aureus]
MLSSRLCPFPGCMSRCLLPGPTAVCKAKLQFEIKTLSPGPISTLQAGLGEMCALLPFAAKDAQGFPVVHNGTSGVSPLQRLSIRGMQTKTKKKFSTLAKVTQLGNRGAGT